MAHEVVGPVEELSYASEQEMHSYDKYERVRVLLIWATLNPNGWNEADHECYNE